MTWRDKMEIGLKKDAPFRLDNLPESTDPTGPVRPAGAGRSPVVVDAKKAAERAPRATAGKSTGRKGSKRTRVRK